MKRRAAAHAQTIALFPDHDPPIDPFKTKIY